MPPLRNENRLHLTEFPVHQASALVLEEAESSAVICSDKQEVFGVVLL